APNLIHPGKRFRQGVVRGRSADRAALNTANISALAPIYLTEYNGAGSIPGDATRAFLSKKIGIYLDRVAGCHCHHRHTGFASVASSGQGQGKSPSDQLPKQSQTNWFGHRAVQV